VELGYSVLEEFQRRGYATEAAGALTAWAFAHTEVCRVIAEALPQRAASIRVLEKSRFQRYDVNAKNGAWRFALPRATNELIS
jgi:RimJ/RimL family protein N-acetyltransferase